MLLQFVYECGSFVYVANISNICRSERILGQLQTLTFISVTVPSHLIKSSYVFEERPSPKFKNSNGLYSFAADLKSILERRRFSGVNPLIRLSSQIEVRHCEIPDV